MKPEAIKVGAELWMSDYESNRVRYSGRVQEIILKHELMIVKSETGLVAPYPARDNQYELWPSNELAQRAMARHRSPWRTDFENMPKDARRFYAIVHGFRGEAWLQYGKWCFRQSASLTLLECVVEDFDCWMQVPDFSMFLEGDE